MTDHKWLGAKAEDNAEARFASGALHLYVFDDGLAGVDLRGAHPAISIVVNCPLSEVDDRTRAWIRSLSALLMPGFGVCPACEKDFNTPDHDPFCSSCVEAGWAEAYRRGHAAGLGADVVALLEAGERLRSEQLPVTRRECALVDAYDAARKKAGR